jgi:hypothetical protein
MIKGDIVGNIIFIDVKDRGETTDVQDEYCETKIVGNIDFGFLMLILDTLSLNTFLLLRLSSNGSIGYMVENIIMRPFQWYMELPLTL